MRLIIFLTFLFFSITSFSQNKQFSLSDTNVEVGDSCYIYPFFGLSGGQPLTPESVKICDSIREFLDNNPSIIIEIQSHTDCRPIPMTNDTLSSRMGRHLKNTILEDSDIVSDRIITIGYGDKIPRIVTAEIHAQNPFLPIGQALTMEFIRTLKTREQQEFTHTLNRRTLIKIIGK